MVSFCISDSGLLLLSGAGSAVYGSQFLFAPKKAHATYFTKARLAAALALG